MTDMGKVRAGAHDTEVEAAERVGVHLRERQQQVLDLLTEYGPMNDDKLRRMLGLKFGPQSKSGPATRRGELVDQGLVRKARDAAGDVVKAPSDAGGNMTVWEVVPEDERGQGDPADTNRLTTRQVRRQYAYLRDSLHDAINDHQSGAISLGEFWDVMVRLDEQQP